VNSNFNRPLSDPYEKGDAVSLLMDESRNKDYRNICKINKSKGDNAPLNFFESGLIRQFLR